MKTLLKLSLSLLVLLFAVNSSATAKKLIVATDTAFVPFEFKKGHQYVGFDIDLWAAIAKEIGVSYVLKPMDFSGIIPALQSGNVDLAIAGISITPERKNAIDFSDGYYDGGLLLMVRSDDDSIQNEQNLKDKVLAVKSGTGSAHYAKANIQFKELRQFPNIDNAYLELAAHRADAVLYDAPSILFFIKITRTTQFHPVGKLIKAQQYGIAFPKGSDDLREKINTALKTLHNNGRYKEIYEKWFALESN